MDKYIKTNVLSFGTEKESQRISSVLIRINLALIYTDKFIQSKGLGVGAGNAEKSISQQEMIATNSITNPHNFFVETLTNEGIVGIFCLLNIILYALYLVIRNWKRNVKCLNYQAILFIIFFISASAIPSSIKTHFVIWIALGYMSITLLMKQESFKEITEEEGSDKHISQQ